MHVSNRPPFAILALAVVLALLAGRAAAESNHDLMPAPERLHWGSGALVLNGKFTVATAGVADPRIDLALARLRARLGSQTGLTLTDRPGGANATLVVEAAAASPAVQVVGEDESYRLTVTSRQARLVAPNPLGVFRGLETFLQLVREEGGRHVVPVVQIEDRPRFPWRGLMLDACRHWQPIDVVKRTLDGLAAVKMNVFHWHLSEDQGFRIESKVFPKLHELGSEGNYYTQEQVKDVITYARERGIRVVPEFDLPGHATSWLVAHPELGSAPGPFTLVREWGIFDNNLDPSRDEVYAFLDKFLGEMAALFPDAYLHIGGDEVTPRQWNENPAIQDFMYRNELRDLGDLQGHFNKKVNAILAKHGKRMVGWDEVLRPDLPKTIVVQSWRGPTALAHAAELGFEGILSNGYYIDLNHPASSHYLSDPIPPDSTLPEDARKRILGGEATMWSEFTTPEVIDSRIWPRTAAIAERLWSPASVRDVEDMYRRMEIQSARLDRLGMKHRAGYEPILQSLSGGKPTASLKVLTDVVEPVKEYRRGTLGSYRTYTPLDRIADAARPESETARVFRRDVDRLILSPAGARDDASLRARLMAWRDNHAVLDPIASQSPRLAEARWLSRDLSAIATIGLQALDALASGRQAPEAWSAQSKDALDRAARPRAAVELRVLPGIRKLALAAGQIDAAKTLSPEEWNRRLEEQLKAPARRGDGH